MTKLQTNPRLVEALKEAAKGPISREEMEEQRVSFIMGSFSLDSNVTREQVRDVLKRERGASRR